MNEKEVNKGSDVTVEQDAESSSPAAAENVNAAIDESTDSEFESDIASEARSASAGPEHSRSKRRNGIFEGVISQQKETGRPKSIHRSQYRRPIDWRMRRTPQASSSVDEFEEATAQAPGSSGRSDAAATDVTDILEIVSRQRWMIGLIVVASLIVGGVAVSRMTPLYSANAELIIEAWRPSLLSADAAVPTMVVDNQVIVSETQVLESRILLSTVAASLDLVNDPEFNSALRPPGLVSRIQAAIGLGSTPPSADRAPDRVIGVLASLLNAAQVGDSRVVEIVATSESADKAALIVNTLIDEYLEAYRSARLETSSETNSVIDQRIAELQQDLLESEQRVESFRSQAELLETGGTTLISQQLAELNAQLIAARSATAVASARLTQLSEVMETTPGSGGFGAAVEVLQSALIQNLRQDQVTVNRRIAELASDLGPAHPTMVQLRAEAADLEKQISIEIDKIAQGLRNELAVARAGENELARQVEQQTARLSQTNEDEIQLRSLEREAEANRTLLETLLARQKEFGTTEDIPARQSDARVISYATAPLAPSYPRKGLTMAVVLFMASLFALVIAFIREFRRRGYATIEQLELALKLPALAFVPLITSRRSKRKLADSVITDPDTGFAQSVKSASWQLDELSPTPTKVVLVTSAIPNEGKTTTAIGLARSKAASGFKTLLIDADMRNPTVAKQMNLPKTPGLRDALESGNDVKDFIVKDEISSLDVLTAGAPSMDAIDWIDSQQMQAVRSELVQIYDFIIMDSPPVLAGPDSCALSRIADTTVLSVRWWSTPASAVQYALRLLRRNGGHVTGTILTMVEVSRHSNYSYGTYGKPGAYLGRAPV